MKRSSQRRFLSLKSFDLMQFRITSRFIKTKHHQNELVIKLQSNMSGARTINPQDVSSKLNTIYKNMVQISQGQNNFELSSIYKHTSLHKPFQSMLHNIYRTF